MKSYFNFLRNNKAYTAIDVLGLSISFMFVILIGAFAWQETHMDHWHSKADRIYALGLQLPGSVPYTYHHWAIQPHLRAAFPEIEKSSAVHLSSCGFHIGDRDVSTLTMMVDSAFLDIFDIELVAGDRSTALADKHSAIVSEQFAQAHFGDADPIGQRFSWQADSVYFVVTGVMREPSQTMFQSYDRKSPDAIVRIEMYAYTGDTGMLDPKMYQLGRNDVYLLGAPGVDLAERTEIYEEYMRSNFEAFKHIGEEGEMKLWVFPLKSIYYEAIQSTSGNHIVGDKSLINVLATVGGVVLLFALLNYVNLTVALAGRRAKEMATRRLLGSSRAAIFARLIGESALLCALSMGIGIALAFLAEPYAYDMFDIYIDIEPCVTPATIGIAFGIFVLLSVSAGIIPAVMISDNKPIDVVRGSFRRQTRMVYSKIIIVVQSTITIAMIVCSLGMWMQVRHLIDAPLGFDTSKKIMIRNIGIGGWRMKIIHDEIDKLAAVTQVSNCYGSPLIASNYNQWEHEGKKFRAMTFAADSTFFDFWGIDVIRDNHIPDGDWVTMEFLTALGLDENAVDFPFHDQRIPVAGIVKDFHTVNILATQTPHKMISIIKLDNPWTMYVGYTGDDAEMLAKVREIYDDVSPIPLDQDVYFVEDHIKETFRDERNLLAIMTTFTIVAILISLLGLLAISTYYVQQREREIAVRKVFGSTASGIVKRVTLTFMVYVGIAFVLAAPLAYMLLGDWLSQFSYRIPMYWWLFAIALVAVMGITLLTVYAQSRNAANSNPINSLKQN